MKSEKGDYVGEGLKARVAAAEAKLTNAVDLHAQLSAAIGRKPKVGVSAQVSTVLKEERREGLLPGLQTVNPRVKAKLSRQMERIEKEIGRAAILIANAKEKAEGL